MRLALVDVNVYFTHDKLTPQNARAAVYGRSHDHWAFIPEVGDVINDFPGYLGDLITVKVVDVVSIGRGTTAYEVTVTDVTP